jgi:starch synthase
VSARDELLPQITDKAVVHGRVTLSSGREADYYVDLRRVTLDAVAAPLVGQAMLESRDVHAISFTGSVGTGRRIAAASIASTPMKKVQLEMGGKNPLVVLDDADLKTAVEAADAVIAVSAGMRQDVLSAYPALDPSRVHVVKNGVDTAVWHPTPPDPEESVLAELGVDPSRPMVAFVGRITRQKGVPHLIAAAHRFDPDVQLVLCAGAPDTPEIAAEVRTAVDELAATRTGVFWVRDFLPVHEISEILSAATAFVCPSVYEPLGIVNLEAMACGTAVVASDVGGIPEVVDDGVTGTLVHYDPNDPRGFEADLAEAVNALVEDPAKAARYGAAGRQRCIDEFSWARIAEQTVEIYRKVSE